MRVLLATILLTSLACIHAAEIDSVSVRSVPLKNAVAELSNIINERIAQGIHRANQRQANDIEDLQQSEFCNKEALYRDLKKSIFQAGDLPSIPVLRGYALDKQLRELLADYAYLLPFEESIFRDWRYSEGYSLKMHKLSKIVNLDGHIVGLDKMGHFFAEGWTYFDIAYLDEHPSIASALAWGKKQEEGKYGYRTTGIHSYADLVANLNGMRFWNRILLNDRDLLTGVFAGLFDEPYVKCKNLYVRTLQHIYEEGFRADQIKMIRAWRQDRPFDLGDYLDGAWDEANNCNSYASTELEEKATRRSREVYENFRCPMLSEECSRAREKYGEYATMILHPRCLNSQ